MRLISGQGRTSLTVRTCVEFLESVLFLSNAHFLKLMHYPADESANMATNFIEWLTLRE